MKVEFFVCGRCLALKDKVVGHTDESGVTLPPLHPRCRCAIMYNEVAAPKKPRGLAAGDRTIDFAEGGKSPYLIGNIDVKNANQVKQALDWFESVAVNAPVENSLIITVTGDVYHCSGGSDTLDTILELGEKLYGAIVTHNHPCDSANEYSFSEDDKNLFINFRLAILRGVDEFFIYEFNRNPNDKEEILPIEYANKFNARHNWVAKFAVNLGIGYKRWAK